MDLDQIAKRINDWPLTLPNVAKEAEKYWDPIDPKLSVKDCLERAQNDAVESGGPYNILAIKARLGTLLKRK